MAVKTVAHIRPVRYIFHDSIFLTELLYLHTTQILSRCSVNRIQIAVFFFKFIDLHVDIFHGLDGKCSILYQGLFIIKLLEFIKRRNSKGSGCRFQHRFNLVMDLQMSAIETTLTVGKRIRRSTQLSEVFVSTDMKLPDQFQVIIQYLKEISVLVSGFGKDHRKMETDRTDVEPSDKYRLILFVHRIHTASFIPWR